MEKRLFEEFLERGELDPEFVARVEEERGEAVQIGLVDFTKRKVRLARALSVLKPEERLSGLKPEDLDQGLANLSEEQQKQLLDLMQKRLKQPE